MKHLNVGDKKQKCSCPGIRERNKHLIGRASILYSVVQQYLTQLNDIHTLENGQDGKFNVEYFSLTKEQKVLKDRHGGKGL
jgi:hypothetical protein